MTEPIRRKTSVSRLSLEAALLHRVRRHLRAGRISHALALAWLLIVRADEQRYRAIRDDQLPQAGVDTLADWLQRAADGEPAEIRDILRLVQNGPVEMLKLLAERLSRGIGTSNALTLNLSESVSGRAYVEVRFNRLDQGVLRRCFNQPPQVVHLFDRSLIGRAAIAGRQHAHPFMWLSPWWIAMDPVDPDQSLSFSVGRGTAAFETWALRMSERDKPLRIYLAEFGERGPEFEDTLAAPVRPGATQAWTAQGLRNEPGMREQVLQHLERALTNGCDVVVFPELCMPSTLRDATAEWLRAACLRAPKGIGCVVAGTFHEQSGGGTYNVGWVMDRVGRPIDQFRHRKIETLHLAHANLTEGIRPGLGLSGVLSSIGLHLLLICLDLCQQVRPLPLSELPLDWVWVPSWSKSVSGHLSRAREMGLVNGAAVVCCNQGPAVAAGQVLTWDTGLSFVHWGGRIVSPAQAGASFKICDVPVRPLPMSVPVS